MKKLGVLILLLVIVAALVWANSNQEGQQIPNPASVYCAEQGGSLEIRSDAEGNQYGVCILPDGRECEEWAFFQDGQCIAP